MIYSSLHKAAQSKMGFSLFWVLFVSLVLLTSMAHLIFLVWYIFELQRYLTLGPSYASLNILEDVQGVEWSSVSLPTLLICD